MYYTSYNCQDILEILNVLYQLLLSEYPRDTKCIIPVILSGYPRDTKCIILVIIVRIS